ncbi:MAG: Holliday junction resolvase RuvX [Cytophagales bacterium]|nr:MAG: Holliday junction resolvase RuvX [Cytophagales bacterium]
MSRLVAIDFGAKRTGIAVTDPLQIIASALDTIPSHTVVAFLRNYAQTEPVEAFVVGMPRRLNGEETDNTPRVKSFVRALQNAFPETPVHLHDERFTSKMALQAMIAGGSSRKDRREKSGNIDKISAAIILQSFMEQQKK